MEYNTNDIANPMLSSSKFHHEALISCPETQMLISKKKRPKPHTLDAPMRKESGIESSTDIAERRKRIKSKKKVDEFNVPKALRSH
jgi:hypothetical protein